MKFLLRQLLLVVAILGLAGQSVAYASSPCAAMAMDQSVSMAKMADCGMSGDKVGKGHSPGKGMMPGCLAMAGCSTPAAVAIQATSVCEPLVAALTATWPVTVSLHGIDVFPELRPPSILG